MKKIFITATDTDAGKTHVAQAVVNVLVKAKQKVAVFKPISAGCIKIDNKLVNEDALLLQAQANSQQCIEQINPIAFEAPIAPHIAANKLDQTIKISTLADKFADIDHDLDYIITEGAGGWRLPLGNGAYLSEFAQLTNQQVILVVNMKLGCLNHAVLTYEGIVNDEVECIGWVANCIEDMPFLTENIAELKVLIPVPHLGCLNHEKDIDKAAKQLNLSSLL